MLENIKLFATDNDRLSYEDSEDYIEPYVSYVEGDNSVHYNKPKFFCKLTLSDNSIIEIEGSGTLTREMVSDQYKNTLVNAEIGESCTSIGNSAFSICSGLTSVTIGSSVTSIGDGAFNGCSSLTSLTIGSSVTSIGDGAFQACNNLINITIPDSVTSIGQGAFYACSGLTSVTIGSGVTSIGNSAFAGCSSLTSVTIPDSVTSIGQFAFAGCSSLTSAIVEATTPPTLSDSVFIANPSGRKIYVPSESVDAYKAAEKWSTYAADIEAIPTT